ncbi:hypothetical protein CAPTEDRAFT_188893 [Capitella teleta]|uniref:Uncharacterized protein n=1 Tax=Capitella teleta TaxID=283909 RepID=R7TR30_CAPTE|nr:hypothetical protein CAPTEDRAFT_188893 [Capitella teleta]|eukprot:ELT96348.1 hypothetical protein CAPTEDRAFT_188893 [Capitella teleta]
MSAPGLSLKRQEHLYNNIKEYVPEPFQDTILKLCQPQSTRQRWRREISLNPEDIDAAHPLTTKNPEDIPTIIVHFRTREKRDKVIAARRLAIRGHEESEGNLRQLLLLRRQDVKPLQQWLHEDSYMSQNYCSLQLALEEIAQICNDVQGAKAGGLLSQLEKLSSFFALKLGLLIFGVTEGLSSFLQGKDLNIGEAIKQSHATIALLQQFRDDAEHFHSFFYQVLEESKSLTDSPTLPRQMQPPRRIDQGAAPHIFESPEDFYRSVHHALLDRVIAEMKSRFSQEKLKLPLAIKSLLLKASNEQPFNPYFEMLKSKYQADVNFGKLQHQLAILPDFLKPQSVSKISTVRSLADILPTQSSDSFVFSEIAKLIRIFSRCQLLLQILSGHFQH